jgi:hypothetical protein
MPLVHTANDPHLLVLNMLSAHKLVCFVQSCSCLELLVCVLNMLLACSSFSEQQLQELQQQSPAAIGADGRFCTLRALSQEAKVDFANTKVRTQRWHALWQPIRSPLPKTSSRSQQGPYISPSSRQEGFPAQLLAVDIAVSS